MPSLCITIFSSDFSTAMTTSANCKPIFPVFWGKRCKSIFMPWLFFTLIPITQGNLLALLSQYKRIWLLFTTFIASILIQITIIFHNDYYNTFLNYLTIQPFIFHNLFSIKRRLLLGKKVMTNLDSILKSRDITLPTKVWLVKAMVFPVVMYGCELDCEESWAPKNWCFWTVVFEKTLESPLDCKEIQPVHPKGDQSWVFTGKTDTEAETPIFWPSHEKSWLIGKDSDAGRDWGQEEKGTTEDEMAGWHHRLNGHEFG